MNRHSKSLKKIIFKFSLICLLFILSCGKGGVQEGESVEWYTKLGIKEVGKQMKKDTQLLTRKLGELEWDDAELLCARIKKSFNKLNLDSPDIPEDFFELKERFDESIEKLLLACQDEDGESAKVRLKALKKTCHHCHLIFRKKLDASNKETDFGVAVDKLYKDKQTD